MASLLALFFALGAALCLGVAALAAPVAAWGGAAGRRWFAAARAVAGPGAAAVVLGGLAVVLAWEAEADWHARMVGVRFVGGTTALERAAPPRHFNGDGESWTRVALPPAVCALLKAQPGRLEGRPERGRDGRWETHTWAAARPDSPDFQEALGLLSWARADVVEEVDQALADGAWLAWSTQHHGEGARRSVANADLALLDLDRCELTTANVNT